MSRRRLRVPAEHGGILCDPPLQQAGDLIAVNQASFQHSSLTILHRPLQELRAQARSEARACAQRFLRKLGIEPPEQDGIGLIITGHQPDLFHPGVWVKNFAAYGLSRRSGLNALNLIVDNDILKTTSIRVPNLTVRPIRTARVPFDDKHRHLPFEESEVQNDAVFTAFPEAVAERLSGVGFVPILPCLWEKVRRVAERTANLGERLAGARRLQEEEWGCRNLELPLSEVCQTEVFAWFAWHLLQELPRFHAIHNHCLMEYRRLRHLRSRNHPVPTLAVDGEWLEAPFWVWRGVDGERQRLFARRETDRLELRLDPSATAVVPLAAAPERSVAGLRELEQAGFKLRTRALTTTLFARLLLADVFIHGIGGAVYDELTDMIIREFYGIVPPGFLTLSATVRLPVEQGPDCRATLADTQLLLRDMWWNPDRHLPVEAENDRVLDSLRRRKDALMMAQPVDPAERTARFMELRRLNEALRPAVADRRSQAEKVLEQLAGRLSEQVALSDREYAFCLHPEAALRGLFQPFLQAANA